MTNTTLRIATQYRDINELAQQLGISVQTLYRWRSEGHDMPVGFKVGNRVRWDQAVIDDWISAQQAKATG